jgi:flagellar hook-associated protein 2
MSSIGSILNTQGTVSVDGAITGLDTSSLISELSSVIGGSRTLMQNQVSELETLTTNFTTLNTRLSTLDTALSDIDTISEFRENTVISPTGSSYTMTATGEAVTGSYTVSVTQLAKAQVENFTMTSGINVGDTETFSARDAALGFGSETLSVTVAGTASTFSVTSATTLDTLASAIDDIEGVTAYVVQTESSVNSTSDKFKLMIQSDDTGTINLGSGPVARISSISSDGSSSVGLDSVQTAQNARVVIGGASGNVIESASNTITAIPGLTITANIADSTEYVSNVSLDTSAMADKISAFVDAFNGVVSFVSTQSSSVTSGTNQNGITLGSFVGESVPRIIVHKLRAIMSADYSSIDENADDIADLIPADQHRTSLSQMGITTLQSGLMSFDSDDFVETLTSYQDDVEKLFRDIDSRTSGGSTFSASFSTAMRDILDAYIDPLTGIIDSRKDGIAEQIDDLTDSITFETSRITRFEARLRAQFTALETLTASFNTTSTFLTSFFASDD